MDVWASFGCMSYPIGLIFALICGSFAFYHLWIHRSRFPPVVCKKNVGRCVARLDGCCAVAFYFPSASDVKKYETSNQFRREVIQSLSAFTRLPSLLFRWLSEHSPYHENAPVKTDFDTASHKGKLPLVSDFHGVSAHHKICLGTVVSTSNFELEGVAIGGLCLECDLGVLVKGVRTLLVFLFLLLILVIFQCLGLGVKNEKSLCPTGQHGLSILL